MMSGNLCVLKQPILSHTSHRNYTNNELSEAKGEWIQMSRSCGIKQSLVH